MTLPLAAMLLAQVVIGLPGADTASSAAEAWVRRSDARFCAGLEPARSTLAVVREVVTRAQHRDWQTPDNKPVDDKLRDILAQRLSDQLAGTQADRAPAPARKNWSGFEGCTLLLISRPLEAGEYAFVFVERDPGGTGGTGNLLALEKIGPRWEVVASQLLWVS